MRNKSIHIKPCSVHWNSMSETEKGKACGFCSKEVIDFTHSSTDEILESLNGKSNVCGRLNSNQYSSIDSDFIKPFATKTNFWKRAAVFFFALIGIKGFMNESIAQNVGNDNIDDGKEVSNSNSTLINFKGKISNQIANSVSVILKINHTLLDRTSSDSFGNFELNFVVDTNSSKEIKLIFESENKHAVKIIPINVLNKKTLLKLEWLKHPYRDIDRLATSSECVSTGDISVVEEKEIHTRELRTLNSTNCKNDSIAKNENIIIVNGNICTTIHEESKLIKIPQSLNGTPASQGSGVSGEKRR